MGRPGLGVFTITPEQDGDGCEGAPLFWFVMQVRCWA